MQTLPQLTSPVFSAAFGRLAGVLIASVWQGILLTAAVTVGLRLLPGLSAAARSAFWTAVLLLVIALPILPLTTSSVGGSERSLWHMGAAISVALVAVWAALSMTRLIQLARSALRLRGVVRRSVPVELLPGVAQLLESGSRRVGVSTSEEVDRPSVAGFMRPQILLPPALFTTLDEAELTQVVLHETEHLRRYDDWINLVQQASLALFPLNPSLFWLNRRLAQERELACDDSVLRTTGARKAYAACLARVAEHSLVRQGVTLALGVLGNWFGKDGRRPELSERVERILRDPAPSMRRTPQFCATACLFAGLCGGASLLARSPQLVSFTPAAPVQAAHLMGPTPAAPLAAINPSNAGVLPVSAMAAARPTFANAVMALPSRSSLAWTASRVERKPRLSRPIPVRFKRKQIQRPSAPHITLAAWQPAVQVDVEQALQRQGESPLGGHSENQSATPAHVTPVLFHLSRGFQVWIAAVPVQGGWLVIQL